MFLTFFSFNVFISSSAGEKQNKTKQKKKNEEKLSLSVITDHFPRGED